MTASMESHCIPYREIPHTTKLFASFLEDFRRVSSFYANPPTSAGIDAAARDVNLDSATRRSVVEILREQNHALRSRKHAGFRHRAQSRSARGRRGRDRHWPASRPFLRPCVHNLQSTFARFAVPKKPRVAASDAVPMFWLASEDHDLAEVNHTFWNTRNGLARYELPPSEKDAGRRRRRNRSRRREIEPLVATCCPDARRPSH